MKISIGFSTCPNDTYIFDALINEKIDLKGLTFEPYLADVEDLNQRALRGELDMTKLSYHAFGHVANQYKVLQAGSALGFGNGPLLVGTALSASKPTNQLRVAIPGELTTANLLMTIAYPEVVDKSIYVFSEIEDAILSGEVDAGVLIHENRFTYQERGLTLIRDLGEHWEKLTHLPIPLGGILVHNRIPKDIQKKIDDLVRSSLSFANMHPESSLAYMQCYAQDMNAVIMQRHVQTFVNDYSLNLGDLGEEAIRALLDHGKRVGSFSSYPVDLFV